MRHTTRAIVLRTIKQSDSRVVVKAYTEQFGTRGYLVRVGGKNGVRNAALQPMQRVEMVVEERAERDLQLAQEIRVATPYVRADNDPTRSALLLFVQEVLYKCLREGSADPTLFRFIDRALMSVDLSDDVSAFPLLFLLQLSKHLGFAPAEAQDGDAWFDPAEGVFSVGAPMSEFALGPPHAVELGALLQWEVEQMGVVRSPLAQRRILLDHLLLFYRMHVEGLGELRSLAVLQQVLA